MANGRTRVARRGNFETTLQPAVLSCQYAQTIDAQIAGNDARNESDRGQERRGVLTYEERCARGDRGSFVEEGAKKKRAVEQRPINRVDRTNVFGEGHCDE